MSWEGKTHCTCRDCFDAFEAKDTREARLCEACGQAGCDGEGRSRCKRADAKGPVRKVYRMCETRELKGDEGVRAVHVTTCRSEEVAWDDRLGVEENHARAAARVLGRAPEFQTSMHHGGFIFGVDPAND